MRRNTRKLLITGFLMLCLAGCGYTTRSMISDKFRTIYVEPFVNKVDITDAAYTANKYRVYRPGLETNITQSAINKYLFDGNLRPVKGGSADLILKGELVEFRRDPLTYTDSENVAEYRLNIVVNLNLWDTKENKLLWQEINFTGDTSYYTSGANAKTEDAAITDALTDLARRIVERTVEEW